MNKTKLDRDKYVLGDASAHVGFLNCERISERSHIHGWEVDTHYHEGLSQLFVFGQGHVESRIDYTRRTIDAPAIAWLPALCSHAFSYQKDMEGWVITVPTADVSRLAAGRVWLEGWISRPQMLCGEQHSEQLAEAERLSRRIEREHRSHGEERNIVLESLFLLALVTLHRGLAIAHSAKAGITDRRQHLVNQFQERLDRHVSAMRSVAEYADMLSVTPTHLSRTVKSVTGRTAGEIIHDRVMLEAKRQLVFTDNSISEIAYALKFSTPSYFTRFFSMQTGENPRSFRRRMRIPTNTLGK
ncbi:AraC family transcriptional regulator [Chelativorans salis]|uniref:AraC family transcriptional regulator n=1 Tax=Chelativorans salis TaxID=2978478 RepID=A0ABT2LUU2_9HYPH|nr:AraC family transcriptional regulator [Chelativorans sp. EGI FJ00035]MCT7378290.1 AraC family transcriptional regulator [Chelativorans sp. EGI FJ00035]